MYVHWKILLIFRSVWLVFQALEVKVHDCAHTHQHASEIHFRWAVIMHFEHNYSAPRFYAKDFRYCYWLLLRRNSFLLFLWSFSKTLSKQALLWHKVKATRLLDYIIMIIMIKLVTHEVCILNAFLMLRNTSETIS